jgi:hypothetical protein
MTNNSVRVLVLLIALAIVIGAPGIGVGPASAAFVQVQIARENFYATGGTAISSCTGEGCTAGAWSVGDTTGALQWHIVEKVFKDTTTAQTQFQYTVTNDAFASNITGLKIWDDGILAATSSLPAGWSLTQTNTWWNPLTSVGTSGIAQLTSKTLTLTVNALVPVVFVNSTGVDFVTGCTTPPCLTSKANWMTVAGGPLVVTPEPATLLLLGTGLAAAGMGIRKRLRGLRLLPSAGQ